MRWKDEAAMQTDFTHWQTSQAGILWVIRRSSVGACAAAFELKHVACAGRSGVRAFCTSDLCASLLRIGEHEEMQADALRYASGHGVKRKAKAHKISDMSAGYKPFDCFTMGLGVVARFVVGFSCARAIIGSGGGARVYALGFEAIEEWRAQGVASITEAMAREKGERMEIG